MGESGGSHRLAPARALHQAGQWPAAQAAYDGILRAEPDNAEACHLAGILALQTGRPARSVTLLSRALQLGRRGAAVYGTLSLALRALHRPDEALASCAAAIAINPDHAEAHFNQALIRHDLHHHAEALAAYDRAIALKPDLHEAWCNRGLALLALRRPDEALASCDRAIALRPDDAASWANRAAVLSDLGRHADALSSHDQAIALRPDFAEAHADRGVLLTRMNRPDLAVASFAAAVALKPDHAASWTDHGLALAAVGRTAEAAASHARAIALRPDFAPAYSNRGLALADLHRHDEALAHYDQAIALQPDLADALWNKAICLLALGDYTRGWPLYEWRKRLDPPMGRAEFPGPAWQGEALLAGKTLFIHWEQGFGDTIQFCRYAGLAVAAGARVVMSVQDALRPLLRQLEPRITIAESRTGTIAFHCHCAMMSLPLAFATTLKTIPAPRSYLAADPAATRRWASRLPRPGRRRIGLAWRGNRAFGKDHARSTDFATIRPLLDIDADWICLLKQPTEQDTAEMRADGRVAFIGDDFADFSDTASVIDLLDLVITTDTSIAHLAGAMGKPVWVLLAHAPDWRWLLHRSDSPWYPSARLFRQSRPGVWHDVIAAVRQALLDVAIPRPQ